jgi:hypothetical protein
VLSLRTYTLPPSKPPLFSKISEASWPGYHIPPAHMRLAATAFLPVYTSHICTPRSLKPLRHLQISPSHLPPYKKVIQTSTVTTFQRIIQANSDSLDFYIFCIRSSRKDTLMSRETDTGTPAPSKYTMAAVYAEPRYKRNRPKNKKTSPL